jgi:hypothetical protein
MTYSDDNIGEVVYEYIDKVLDDTIKCDGQYHEHTFDNMLHLYIQNRVDHLQFVFKDLRVHTCNPINYLHIEPKPLPQPFKRDKNGIWEMETTEVKKVNVFYSNPKLYFEVDIERSDVRRVKKMVATDWSGFGYGRTVDEYTEVEETQGGNILNPEGLKRKALQGIKKHIIPDLGPYLNRTTIFINSTNFELK